MSVDFIHGDALEVLASMPEASVDAVVTDPPYVSTSLEWDQWVYIYARSQHGQAIHPTQKPEAIVEPLIINACPVGGVVLDLFAGSGTTGYVAHRLGRSAILIEKYTPHFEAMRKRFTDDLFTADI